jgi:hypothetical protein
MKTTLLALCLLCASAAFGQAYPSLTPLEFADHSQHASAQPMSSPVNILSQSVVVASGEVPLADIPMPEIHETPLGDVARQVRKEHLTAKKAQKVWETQNFGTSVVQVR